MKHTFLLTAFGLATLMAGCATVKSDYSYQKGSQSFWNGDYDSAIAYLTQAVELDPVSARNHFQLACTYQRIGNVSLAWEHARKTLQLDSQYKGAIQTFSQIFTQISKEHQLERRKLSAGEVIDIFGIADQYVHNEKGDLQSIYYGPVCLHFAQGKLASTEWMYQHLLKNR